MHTVELLEEACEVARTLGYGIRYEWLGGSAGGGCEVAGRKWLFVDLALNPIEQLDQVLETLKADRSLHTATFSEPLREQLDGRRAA